MLLWSKQIMYHDNQQNALHSEKLSTTNNFPKKLLELQEQTQPATF